jgi:alpha-beta hydrolase superfamily lysophospholipase
MYGRRLMSKLAADLAANGVAAWNLDYRGIGGGGGWPATFDDLAAGIDALAAVPSLDLSRVTAVGHSPAASWRCGRRPAPACPPGRLARIRR